MKPKTGRPTVKEADRKQSYTVSLSSSTRTKLVKKFGSLTQALESIEV